MKPIWSTDPLPEGTWCWVYCGSDSDGPDIFLAMKAEDAVGGWTNEDCWEDFNGEVQCWIPIEKPKPPTIG